jgi:hypothetical protein
VLGVLIKLLSACMTAKPYNLNPTIDPSLNPITNFPYLQVAECVLSMLIELLSARTTAKPSTLTLSDTTLNPITNPCY